MKKSDIEAPPDILDRYINLVEDIDIMEAFERYGINTIQSELPMLEKLGNRIYAPNKWTAKDILQHITDTERVFAYRALRFARKDRTPMPGYDENLFSLNARANDKSLTDLIEEFTFVRKSTVALFKNFSIEDYLQKGICLNKEMSAISVGFAIVGHFQHHFQILRERYYPLN